MSPYQDFIDASVKAGIAPGLSAIVFDKDGEVFNGTSGVVSWNCAAIAMIDKAPH
jgi:hypothetical protein